MKMAEVCDVFTRCGMTQISSVLATGNIVFSSTKSKSVLKKMLEKAMSEHYHYEAFLFLKTQDEMAQIVKKNPFKPQTDFHIYGFIGVDEIEKVLNSEFEKAQKSDQEEAKIADGSFYWKISKGNTLNSEFGKILGNKKLKNSFTSRNLNTLEKVLKKM